MLQMRTYYQTSKELTDNLQMQIRKLDYMALKTSESLKEI